MNIKTIIGLIVIVVAVWFVMTQCCIYTSIATYTVADMCGMDPIICNAEVEGEDYYHAYIRIKSQNIETQTLNLWHVDNVDYDNPVTTFETIDEFIDCVDMWSPVQF